ncbi:hypothetical protein Tco_0035715, partial [Tanacetum coccineum]
LDAPLLLQTWFADEESLRRKTSHSQLVDQKVNSISAKRFSEDVCQLILRIDKVKFDHLILNMFLDKVKSDVYMLGSYAWIWNVERCCSIRQ